MKYRINFDSKSQLREYLEYYRSCKEIHASAESKVIITLYRMGWTRGKIIARTRPKITEYQIKKVIKSIPSLTQLSRLIRKNDVEGDAMDYVDQDLIHS